MSSIKCAGCGTAIDPDAVEYCRECSTPVEYSLQERDEPEPTVQAEENKQDDDTYTTDTPSTTSAGDSTDTTDTSAEPAVSCPKCGSSQKPQQNFCRSCVTILDTEQSTTDTTSDTLQPAGGDVTMWLDLGGHPVQLSDGDSVGRELREIIADLRSREEALYISREQFEVAIDVDEGQCWLRDGGSENGTTPNGQELMVDEYQQVTDGDTLVLPPDTEATVRIENATIDPSAEDAEPTTDPTIPRVRNDR